MRDAQKTQNRKMAIMTPCVQEWLSFMAATMTVKVRVVVDWDDRMVFPLVGRMHTMSAHKADGYRDASDKFSRMGHSILLCTPTRCSVCNSRVKKRP